MAFEVQFFNHAKALNSTKRPAAGTAGLIANCVLKAPCSVLSPVIELSVTAGTFPSYNYAYIPAFSRYYFVSNWRWEGGLWLADLTDDPMASWKTAIGATRAYILRSASSFDRLIRDTIYPCETLPLTATDSGEVWWNSTSYASGGCYVVAVLAASDTSLGNGVSYLIMDAAGFRNFASQILDSNMTAYEDQGGTLAEIGLALSRLIVDPFEYVKSVRWYPFSIPAELATQAHSVSAWKIGFWTFQKTAGNIYMMPTAARKTFTQNFTLRKHHQASRGTWTNAAPYTDIQLYLPRLGAVPVDVNRIVTDDTLYITLDIDLASGEAIYKIKSGLAAASQSDPFILATYTCNMSVDIPLAQERVTVAEAMQELTGVAASAASLPATGAIGAMSGIESLVRLYEPHLSSLGNASGSFYDLATIGQTEINYRFYVIVDEDNANQGRPLCKMYRIDTQSGFVIVQDGHVEISGAYQPEIEQITSYLESGFYYE